MKLLIGADLVPTEHTEKLFIDKDVHTLFGDVCDHIKAADRFIINLECALTLHDVGIKKIGPCLKADPRCAAALKTVGVTDVMLSNNHIFDYGVKGLNDTVAALEGVGLPYSGIGENDTDSRKKYVIESCGKRIGIINVCEHEYSYALPDRMGANPFDPYLTMKDIRNLKGNTDHVVVLYHGGKEHCSYPSPRLRNLAQEMIDCGASVVIAQHSHCIGCYEKYNGGHIVYGQGNLHFCWNGMPNTWYSGLLIELDVDKNVNIEFKPFIIGDNGISMAHGKDKDEILSAFEKRNEELKNGQWLQGWRDFCHSVAGVYEDALYSVARIEKAEDRTQLFSHYLDCEAHTDVWRELYPTWNATNEK